MAYIGNDLQVAYPTYKNIDDISGSFNGSTTSFALLVGGVAPSPLPLNSQQCLISVGGVIQRPDDTGTEGFRLSGGNIVFSSAPNTGEDFFGIILAGADYVNVGANFPSGSAAVPSITFDSDLDTGIYNSAANQVGIACAGSSVSVFSSAGQSFLAGSAGAPSLYPNGDTNTGIWSPAADTIAISTGGSERTRVDSSGRLLVGTSSAYSGITGQLLSTAAAGSLTYAGLGVTTFSSSTGNQAGSLITLDKSNSNTLGTNTAVTNGDQLGIIAFRGADGGSNFRDAAYIQCFVDGTVSGGGAADMPGRLVFSTTADGASSPTERMRIDRNGVVTIGPSTTNFNSPGVSLNPEAAGQAWFVRDNNYVMYVNRLTSDGDLVQFAQGSTLEGTISVSGTTVSYNGAHLSRWSQLPFGAERTEILRGSVLSNIDEMCEWTDEENEQLNRMKVSNVEGDKNVSGVFQAWDDDDDTYTNDFYCAMTGDFIIRIGAGVTVERGDLLMSAGDGTAKPQDDDIIRSKTIAKVTSTNVSCTYDDGSYCVPCVLMAC